MSVGVNPPKTPVTKGSKGIAMATLPNVCKMPGPPAPFVPAPLPNIGKSGDKPKGYTKKVKVEGDPVAVKGASFCSMGDMASKGTGGGMASANTHGPCKFIGTGSMDVKFEGKNVQLLSDPVTNNGGGSGSPANSATLMGLLQISVPIVGMVGERVKCPEWDCDKYVTVQPPPTEVERTLEPGKQSGHYTLDPGEVGISVWTKGMGPKDMDGKNKPGEIRSTKKLRGQGFEVVQTHSCNLSEPRASNHFEIMAKRKPGENMKDYQKRNKRMLKNL